MSFLGLFGDDERDESDRATDGGDPLAIDAGESNGGVADDPLAFDDAEDEGGSVAELESRVDDIESELESLSSMVTTVRSENEEVDEAIEEIEENVRKLLEIYEAVTQGVNPLVDEAGPTVSGSGGSFGLVDSATTDDPAAGEAEQPNGGTEGETPDDGTSFDDIKADYGTETDDTDRTDASKESNAADRSDASDDADADETTTLESILDAEKPYLTGLPEGYVADLLVLDWLEYLVASAGHAEARDAIDYYTTIEWIDDDAATQLQAFLNGFDGGDDGGAVTVEQHTQSLQYICKLDNNAAAAAVDDGTDPASTEEGS